MAIPKIIIQTYKTSQLPLVARLMIKWLKFKNPTYQYEFYDDARIQSFIKANYEERVVNAYLKLDIGAAKADFFRYLALYQAGGIYMDLDAYCTKSFDIFLLESDTAVLSMEGNPGIYAQYALIFAAKHPILKTCIDTIVHNIEQRLHVNDIHKLTGPSVYTDAVNAYLNQTPDDKSTRYIGIDYNNYIKPKYWLHAGLFSKREKWQTAQQARPAVKP